MCHHHLSRKSGFTLIELLIVVLIIAVLAAISVPNFLDFQTRAKVSRVKSDMRSLATAIEAYLVDNGIYPQVVDPIATPLRTRLKPLTTPIGYISTAPADPFKRLPESPVHGEFSATDPSGELFLYNTGRATIGNGGQGTQEQFSWSLSSSGPDLLLEFPYWPFADVIVNSGSYVNFVYDPTNGTLSDGEIFRRGGRVARPLSMIDQP